MSPPAETQPDAEQRERVVDRATFHDAVQVEHDGCATQQHPPTQANRLDGLDRHGLDRAAVKGEIGEVTVVTRGSNCATDGRGDPSAGGARCVECEGEHRREVLRHQHHAEGSGIDAVELGGWQKSAETAVALVEERAHSVERCPVGQDDRRSPST